MHTKLYAPPNFANIYENKKYLGKYLKKLIKYLPKYFNAVLRGDKMYYSISSP